jgi:hypothetical protein
MIVLTWTDVGGFRCAAEDVTASWLLGWEDLPSAAKYLRLKATGQWTPMSGLPECGPDGIVGQAFPSDRLILPDCAVGALLGRIGGSSATLKPAGPADRPAGPAEAKSDSGSVKADSEESKPFAIGSHAVIKLPETGLGPLFIGFNILLRPVPVRALQLTIECSG